MLCAYFQLTDINEISPGLFTLYGEINKFQEAVDTTS